MRDRQTVWYRPLRNQWQTVIVQIDLEVMK